MNNESNNENFEKKRKKMHKLRGWICWFGSAGSCIASIMFSETKLVKDLWIVLAILAAYSFYYHLGEGETIKSVREKVDFEIEKKEKEKKDE